MIEYLLQGTVLGLSAGLGPGPLLTLVVTETMRHGSGAGVRAALAPLFTDIPIIAVAMLVLTRISSFGIVLGMLTLFGALFVLHLGWENIRTKKLRMEGKETRSFSLRRGIIVNALSPHPYLFWLGVGGPITQRAVSEGAGAAAAFVGTFYILLVGSKVAVALAAGRSRRFLSGVLYIWIMRALGILLCLLALALAKKGLELLGLL